MAKSEKQLILTIEQTGKVYHHQLRNGSGFTIGKHPENDVTLYGDHIPKKHTLITKKNGHYELKLKNFMTGEVIAGKSRLAFNDMIAHELLSLKGDTFRYPLTHGKEGYVQIGETRISFKFIGKEQLNGTFKGLDDFRGYSWMRATLTELRRDIPFKALVLSLVVLHAFLLSYIGKFSTPTLGSGSVGRVPDRFAKIIVRTPPEADLPKKTGAARANQKQADADKKTSSKKKKAKPDKSEKQGLLGLLTGTGVSNQSGSLADMLLDKGLAKELDAVMETSELDLGNGTSDLSSDLDDLIAFNEDDGGIDDFLGDVEEVESVDLGERAQVQVDQVGSMTGSEEALGKRSEESIRTVIQQNQGRLTYTYKKYLRKNHDFRGKLVLELTIAADGRVERISIAESNTNNAEFDNEILSFVRRWKFPVIDYGTVTVTVPLFFNKIG